MHQRLRSLLVLLTLLLGIIACTIGTPQPTPTTAPDQAAEESQPTAQATQIDVQPTPTTQAVGETGGGGELPTPTPQTGAVPPLLTTWPLEADLFYLNSAGQVWRQPLLGDESAAAAVTDLDQVVLDFAIAPGGEWILYRTPEFIGVREVHTTNGQLIADAGPMPPATWPGHTLAWSADGSKVAYTNADGFEVYIPGVGPDLTPAVIPITERLISDISWSQDAGYLMIQRDDGSAALYQSAQGALSKWVELGTLNSYAWLADGRLAFSPIEGGLAVVNPADLNSRSFVVAQDRPVTLIGEREDGTIAFFVHDASKDEAGFLHLANPADLSFRQESGTPIDTAGKAWAPGALRLISPQFNDPSSTTVEFLDPATDASTSFEASGQPISFDWGSIPPRAVAGMPLPSNLYFLAPQAGIIQVWRMPLNGDEPTPITNAAADVLDYDISPDGTAVVFTSGGVVQVQVIGAAEVTPVVTLPATARTSGTPGFSLNGRQVAYANGGIWMKHLDTNQETRLVTDNIPTDPERENEIVVYSNPQFSPDGQWILATAGYYEGYDFVLISTSGTPREPIPLNLYVADAIWTDDNRVLVYSTGGSYNEPALTLVTPGSPPTIQRLLDVPVLDAVQREAGEVAFLRIPSPFGLGPTSVTLNSVPLTGGSPLTESTPLVISQPQLSPDGTMIAGLIQMRIGEFGGFSGRLAIANPATGEVFLIEGFTNVSSIKWK